MVVDNKVRVDERTDLANRLWPIQKKIIDAYPEAEFDLATGPDDAFNLKVYTNEASLWRLVELVEDDLDTLHYDNRLDLHIIPLLLADRDADRPRIPRDFRASPPGTNGTH